MKLAETDFLNASYELTRLLLFASCYVGTKSLRRLRTSLGISPGGFVGNQTVRNTKYTVWVNVDKKLIKKTEEGIFYITDKSKRLQQTLQRVQSILLLPVHNFALRVNLDPYGLEHIVLFNSTPESEVDMANVRVVSYGGNPIYESGVYIQITPKTRVGDLEDSFKFAQMHYGKFFSLTEGHRDQKGTQEKRDINIYLTVEKCLGEWIQTQRAGRKDKEYDQVQDTYISRTIALALEELGMKDTKKNRDWIEHIYYRIIDRYQLPLFTELKTYLQLIRR